MTSPDDTPPSATLPSPTPTPTLQIGWGMADITPCAPVLIAGQACARVSEGVLNPLTVTALVLQSGEEVVVFVSCDVICISEALLAAVREKLVDHVPIAPEKVILHATHTHTGPALATGRYGSDSGLGDELPLPEVQDIAETLCFTSQRIVEAIATAWGNRAPGAIAYGLGHAVISYNRRWVDKEGKSTMYQTIAHDRFSHVEGYEDHDLNLLATYDLEGRLTGLALNVASPAQVRERLYELSADYWHETRAALRQRFGEGLPILAQCSAAGDQSPFRIRPHIHHHRAEERMLGLKSRDDCEEIAQRLSDGVAAILPWMAATRETAPVLTHTVRTLHLPFNTISAQDAEEARAEAALHRQAYEEGLVELEKTPDLRQTDRWYHAVSRSFALLRRHQRVVERFERLRTSSTFPVEAHFIRIGEMAFATNPFELYLDYGIQIKARSPAVQTFVIQLCGPGSYLPSRRSLAGGGYGSTPASNIFGPEAADLLTTETLRELDRLWGETSGYRSAV